MEEIMREELAGDTDTILSYPLIVWSAKKLHLVWPEQCLKVTQTQAPQPPRLPQVIHLGLCEDLLQVITLK